MIDFKAAKKLLLPLLIQRGYAKRSDKSSAGHLVMQNHEGQTRILRPNPRGEFDYYYNPGDDTDFGDAVQFLTRELFGNYAQRLTRPQYIQLEQAIRAVDPAANITEHTQQALTVFDLSQHDLIAIEREEQIPVPDLYLLRQRGIPPQTLLDPLFSSSVRVKNSTVGGRAYQNLLFLWRDAAAVVVGGQYKYIKDGVCHKHFLIGTARGSSLWYSDLSNAKKLLVCEDPLDALAHHLLFNVGSGGRGGVSVGESEASGGGGVVTENSSSTNCKPDNNNGGGVVAKNGSSAVCKPDNGNGGGVVGEYAYAATGGRVTVRQIALLYWLAEREGLQLVLGNDNDAAGAVSNLRIADRWGSLAVDHDHDHGTITVTRRPCGGSNAGGGDLLFAGDEQSFQLYVSTYATHQHIPLAQPTHKDWNAQLLGCRL